MHLQKYPILSVGIYNHAMLWQFLRLKVHISNKKRYDSSLKKIVLTYRIHIKSIFECERTSKCLRTSVDWGIIQELQGVALSMKAEKILSDKRRKNQTLIRIHLVLRRLATPDKKWRWQRRSRRQWDARTPAKSRETTAALTILNMRREIRKKERESRQEKFRRKHVQSQIGRVSSRRMQLDINIICALKMDLCFKKIEQQ